MAQTPLELLTVIAAPALITNASSVLILSTSNRFARSLDRVRAVAAELDKIGEHGDRRHMLLHVHRLASGRTRILVRALTSFYLAVGSFAFGTFIGLVGAGAETLGFSGGESVLTGLALGVVTIGTLAIAAGAVMLVHETRLALKGLLSEAAG